MPPIPRLGGNTWVHSHTYSVVFHGFRTSIADIGSLRGWRRNKATQNHLRWRHVTFHRCRGLCGPNCIGGHYRSTWQTGDSGRVKFGSLKFCSGSVRVKFGSG
uniref:Uncharacterized protein n=1 Tax=Opuntia streptacantha TaxID=393608 RepID=A0A7C9CRM2_OPUST